MKNKSLLIIAFCCFSFYCGCAKQETVEPVAIELVTVKSADYGDTQHNIIIEEVERTGNISKLKLTYDELGSSVGSSMFIMRGFYEVSKARGTKYFINLKEWEEPDGSRMYIGGFTNKRNADIHTAFGEEYSLKNAHGQKRRYMSVAQCELIWGSQPKQPEPALEPEKPEARKQPVTIADTIVAAAIARTKKQVRYDPAYVSMDYPGGDVPDNTGVCTDVIIRSLRGAGIDLQLEVHEDMKADFDAYPKNWSLQKPDSNIDHRRVPNLMRYFKRKGLAVPVTQDPADYKPGDIVAWKLSSPQLHIGIVSNIKNAEKNRYQIIHNIGAGTRLEDCLFTWSIIGHYRFIPIR